MPDPLVEGRETDLTLDEDNSRAAGLIETRVLNQRITGLTCSGGSVVISLENGVDLLFNLDDREFKVGVWRAN
jgi:hypothetical protein